jgi:small subunit ribosomal protein S16
MVVIRLSRGGAPKRAFYHIVATDKRNARDAGTHLEQLGFFNPCASGQEVRLNLDRARVDYWLSKGAKPSDRVQKLLKDAAA